ncbi:hypothetical protein BJ986_000193 [Phycicoccus badiiscoriae]|uniref:Helix-turn-helix domain-containing protein n=1 Tax=Pedococcus badiiscoriae TaxID=642776 RepID=A0A852WJJ9_9MICO|nr:hypothetical protein [Pedococcus badiiscoriae]NYG05706.1 hypothetical protein [Pedococcus badiiscoriae]
MSATATATQTVAPISVAVREAALLTAFPEYEIRVAISKGSLPCHRLGKRFVILVDELQAWVSALPGIEQESTAPAG